MARTEIADVDIHATGRPSSHAVRLVSRVADSPLQIRRLASAGTPG
jgi:hypothetical protein